MYDRRAIVAGPEPAVRPRIQPRDASFHPIQSTGRLMKRFTLLLAMAAAPAVAVAQQPPVAVEDGAANLALVTAPAKNNAKLTVSTPGWQQGGDIPFEFTQY